MSCFHLFALQSVLYGFKGSREATMSFPSMNRIFFHSGRRTPRELAAKFEMRASLIFPVKVSKQFEGESVRTLGKYLQVGQIIVSRNSCVVFRK